MSQIVDIDGWLAAQPLREPDEGLVEPLMAGDLDDGQPGSRVPGMTLPPHRPRRIHERVPPRYRGMTRVGEL